eukprot:1256964-Rhodomonas_salina.2
MHSPSGRYLLVAASLAALAAVALLGLAADQARDIGRGDELAQVRSLLSVAAKEDKRFRGKIG